MVNLFHEIKKTSGSNAKLALAKEKFTPHHHQFFEVCFNDVRYGISGSGIKKAIQWTDEFGKGEDIAAFVDSLYGDCYEDKDGGRFFARFGDETCSTNVGVKQFAELIEPLSGNAQIEKFSELLKMMPHSDIMWVIRAIQKDMRIGLSLSSYNKVREHQGMKPLEKRGVQLCGKREVTPDMENFADLSYPRIAEYKYDGERTEITLTKQNVTRDFGDGPVTTEEIGCKLISRGNKDITERYPEVVKFLKNGFANPIFETDITKVVYDSEIISKDFITLSKRMQRKSENIEEEDTDLKAILFDILEVTTEEHGLVKFKDTLQVMRRQGLEAHSDIFGWDLSYIKHVATKEELYQFYLDARKIDQEGLVTKDYDMIWTPHSRDGWTKLVPREHLDLKVVEGHYGNGIFSKFINCLTVENKDGTIKTNVASGIKNIEREELTKLFDSGNLEGLVVEIAYRELCPAKDGVSALRFPVFIRIRDDKSLAEID